MIEEIGKPSFVLTTCHRFLWFQEPVTPENNPTLGSSALWTPDRPIVSAGRYHAGPEQIQPQADGESGYTYRWFVPLPSQRTSEVYNHA